MSVVSMSIMDDQPVSDDAYVRGPATVKTWGTSTGSLYDDDAPLRTDRDGFACVFRNLTTCKRSLENIADWPQLLLHQLEHIHQKEQQSVVKSLQEHVCFFCKENLGNLEIKGNKLMKHMAEHFTDGHALQETEWNPELVRELWRLKILPSQEYRLYCTNFLYEPQPEGEAITTTASHFIDPTYNGYIGSRLDDCLLLEACLSGKRSQISRFPRQDELKHVVRSGSTWMYDERLTEFGIWNDGIVWMHYECEDKTIIERHKGLGLFKRSGSVVYNGFTHSFVSYYTAEDVPILPRPSQDPAFQKMKLRSELAALVPPAELQQHSLSGDKR